MMCLRVGTSCVFACVMCFGSLPAGARTFRVEQAPNGSVYGCTTCHTQALHGGPRNAFGQDVEATLLPPPGSDGEWQPSQGQVDWAAVCSSDSDDDGKTNGEELGDPCCVWTLGADPLRVVEISRPGSGTSTTPCLSGCPAPEDLYDGGCALPQPDAGVAGDAAGDASGFYADANVRAEDDAGVGAPDAAAFPVEGGPAQDAGVIVRADAGRHPDDGDVQNEGGAGCACSTSGSSSLPHLLGLTAALVLTGRRRSRPR